MEFVASNGKEISESDMMSPLSYEGAFLSGFLKPLLEDRAPQHPSLRLKETDKYTDEFLSRVRELNVSTLSVELLNTFVCGILSRHANVHTNRYRTQVKMVGAGLDKTEEDILISLGFKESYSSIEMSGGMEIFDFLYHLYENVPSYIKKEDRFYNNMVETLNTAADATYTFKYKRLREDAIAPEKSRITDSGYDVHAIELEHVSGNLYKANTHLAVKPSPGWYFDLIGRSSLPGKGWHFAGGVGVIDMSYQGPLIMKLEKMDDRPMPDLPFKCGQLVPRRIIHKEFEEVDDLGASHRGSGGFGSTD